MRHIKHKLTKFKNAQRNSGMLPAVMMTFRYSKDRIIKGRRGSAGPGKIELMARLDDIMDADFTSTVLAKKRTRKMVRKNEPLTIGWVMSPISYGSGGQRTITRFINHLNTKGHRNIVLLYDGIYKQPVSEAKQILDKGFQTVTEVRAFKRDATGFDILMATGWETAYPVFNAQTEAEKWYFIQDFEPLFYAMGSKYILAENTYKFGFRGLTAGPWLTKKISADYGMRCDYFDFGADEGYVLTNLKKRKKVCFYARPATERRAFELGILALQIFKQQHPEYEIVLFGWDISTMHIPFKHTQKGILNLEGMVELYNDSAACLVMSLTNCSLLPQELLATGCAPVLNEGDNNRMVVGENKYVYYAQTSPQDLARKLSEAVQNHSAEYARKAADSVRNRSWHEAGEKAERILLGG